MKIDERERRQLQQTVDAPQGKEPWVMWTIIRILCKAALPEPRKVKAESSE